MFTLYGGGETRSAVVEAVLVELGLDYELVPIDITRGENRSPSFLAINPAGFVPALTTPEGETLHETNAITLWLADRYREPPLAPAVDAPERGRFLSRFGFIWNDIEARTKSLFYPQRYSTDASHMPGIIDATVANLEGRWAVVDRWLGDDGPYVMGETFTVADIYLALWAAYGFVDPEEITRRFANVARCYDLVVARPGAGPIIGAIRQAGIDWREKNKV